MIPNNLLLPIRRWNTRRHFFGPGNSVGQFYGRFGSYCEAQQYAERYSDRVEYCPAHGEQLVNLSKHEKSSSAALTCLQKIAYPGMRVARLVIRRHQDAGGEDGYPRSEGVDQLDWIDLKGLEQNTTLSNLQFARIALHDAVLAQCVLPYLSSSLSDELLTNDAQPAHIILEGLPLSSLSPFVTLHNVSGSIIPFRVGHSQAWIDSLSVLGYHLVRQWRETDNSIDIPPESGLRIEFGHGMHFQHGYAEPS